MKNRTEISYERVPLPDTLQVSDIPAVLHILVAEA